MILYADIYDFVQIIDILLDNNRLFLDLTEYLTAKRIGALGPYSVLILLRYQSFRLGHRDDLVLRQLCVAQLLPDVLAIAHRTSILHLAHG